MAGFYHTWSIVPLSHIACAYEPPCGTYKRQRDNEVGHWGEAMTRDLTDLLEELRVAQSERQWSRVADLAELVLEKSPKNKEALRRLAIAH